MGIEKYNIAVCDKCKREYRSQKTQAALKKELQEKGWSFKGDDVLCASCSGHRIYTGAIKETKKIGDKFYVEVINDNITVYIPYDDFFEKTSINTLPSTVYLKDKIKKAGGDPDKIKYHETDKVLIDKHTYFIAKLYFE